MSGEGRNDMKDHLISRTRFLDALVLDADHKTDLIQVHHALEKAVVEPDVIHCEDCRFWESPPSCEGLAKCATGESGIRYRSRKDFCSKGMPCHKSSKGAQ